MPNIVSPVEPVHHQTPAETSTSTSLATNTVQLKMFEYKEKENPNLNLTARPRNPLETMRVENKSLANKAPKHANRVRDVKETNIIDAFFTPSTFVPYTKIPPKNSGVVTKRLVSSGRPSTVSGPTKSWKINRTASRDVATPPRQANPLPTGYKTIHAGQSENFVRDYGDLLPQLREKTRDDTIGQIFCGEDEDDDNDYQKTMREINGTAVPASENDDVQGICASGETVGRSQKRPGTSGGIAIVTAHQAPEEIVVLQPAPTVGAPSASRPYERFLHAKTPPAIVTNGLNNTRANRATNANSRLPTDHADNVDKTPCKLNAAESDDQDDHTIDDSPPTPDSPRILLPEDSGSPRHSSRVVSPRNIGDAAQHNVARRNKANNTMSGSFGIDKAEFLYRNKPSTAGAHPGGGRIIPATRETFLPVVIG